MPRARAMMSGYPAGSAMRGWRSADGAVNGRLRIALGRAFSARSTGRSRGLRLVPRSAALARMPPDIQRRCALGGGDDYELCFTAPVGARAAIADISARLNLP